MEPTITPLRKNRSLIHKPLHNAPIPDPSTEYSEEEMKEKVYESLRQIAEGKCYTKQSNENIRQFINRMICS